MIMALYQCCDSSCATMLNQWLPQSAQLPPHVKLGTPLTSSEQACKQPTAAKGACGGAGALGLRSGLQCSSHACRWHTCWTHYVA
jgi:hypothetical protein